MRYQSSRFNHAFPILVSSLLFFSVVLSVMGGESGFIQNDGMITSGQARFTVITPGLVRLEYSPDSSFVDNRTLFAENRNERCGGVKAAAEKGTLIIESPLFTLIYKPDGKPFSAANLEVRMTQDDWTIRSPGLIRWTPGMPNPGNLGGTNRTLDGANGWIPIDPGILSRDGWYLLDDSGTPVLTSDWVAERPAGYLQDWYLFVYGLDYPSALQSLTAIGGAIPLPRKYQFGSWYSRYWPYSTDDYKQIVQEYDSHGFPLDIMVLDMDWHKDGWTGWSWNRKLLPDPKGLLTWLHEQGMAVTMNLHPADGIGPHEDMYRAFMNAIRNIDLTVGVDAVQHPDSVIPYDVSDKRYLDTLFKFTHDPLEADGVDFWWVDWQQFDKALGMPSLRNLPWLNRYYFHRSEKDGKRGASFSRWGGWGDHKYPIHFSGDSFSNWASLEFQVPFTSTAGNAGCFFWSHDIGGHQGGMDPEVNARWVQFGATTAALRLHSTRDAKMDKRPWLAGPVFEESMRRAFRLRSELFPYLYSSAYQSVKKAIPLNCPMYFRHSDREEAYLSPQQYFFGPAFLAVPIVQPGVGEMKVASQRVWFPEGTWFNWFTGEKWTGDKTITAWADLNEFPLFVQAGVPIPMQTYSPRMAAAPLSGLVVRVYPGESGTAGTFELYEDDGISREYQNGKFAVTKIDYLRRRNKHRLTIHPTRGEFDGQVKERSVVFELPVTEKAESAWEDGRPVPIEYDSIGVNRIRIPARSIRDSIVIELTASELDQAIIHKQANDRLTGEALGESKNQPAERILDEQAPKYAESPGTAALVQFVSGLDFSNTKERVFSVFRNASSIAEAEIRVRILDKRSDGQTASVRDTSFQLSSGKEIRIEAVPMFEVKGIRVERFAEVTFSCQGKSHTISHGMAFKDSYLTRWNLIGPFSYDSKRDLAEFVYPPQTGPAADLSAAYPGSSGQPASWIPSEQSEDQPVVDLRPVYDFDNRIAYAMTYLDSDRDQPVEFVIQSDDGVEVWINREKIHSHNVFRGIAAEGDDIKGRLRKGSNELLLKIANGSAGWAFKVKILARHSVRDRINGP